MVGIAFSYPVYPDHPCDFSSLRMWQVAKQFNIDGQDLQGEKQECLELPFLILSILIIHVNSFLLGCAWWRSSLTSMDRIYRVKNKNVWDCLFLSCPS